MGSFYSWHHGCQDVCLVILYICINYVLAFDLHSIELLVFDKRMKETLFNTLGSSLDILYK